MKIKEFKLERLFARYVSDAKYMLSQVSCEACMMKEILEANASRPVPKWLDVNRQTQEAKILAYADREDIDLPIEETLIVELYSK